MDIIVVDEEFKGLLPPLDATTYARLEDNLIRNGCRDSLVLWGDTLVDGHNRYEICTRHGIPFNTVQKEFGSREEAMIWIISTQISRRNMTPLQLSHFRGMHYRLEKRAVGNPTWVNQHTDELSQVGTIPQTLATATSLAEKYNVSRNTINRDSKISDALDKIGATSPEAKRMILAGDVNVSKRYLEELSSRPKEEIDELAVKIEDGTYEKRGTEPQEQAEAAEPPKPADAILAKMHPLSAVVNGISDEVQSVLSKVTKKADRTKLKTTLRTYIDALEEIYEKI